MEVKITSEDIKSCRGLINSFRSSLKENVKSEAKTWEEIDVEIHEVKERLRQKFPKSWTGKSYEILIYAPYFIAMEFGLSEQEASKQLKDIFKEIKING